MTSWIMRTNPVARMASGLALSVAVISTLDPVSAAVALALELLVILTLRLPARLFWTRTAPIWIAAPLAALTIALYGQPAGTVYVEFLLIRVSDGSLALALATGLRVLAIGLPAVVLFLGVDPTELADGLIQRVRLPARAVVGALAGMRLITLFGDEWRALELARRARGVADRGRIRRFAGQAYALLVISIRRGSALATAMEARGFGAPVPRSNARVSPWGVAEWLVIVGGAAIGALAVTAAVVAGTWSPVVG
jgi:energy-coupling factor transport system permease protein